MTGSPPRDAHGASEASIRLVRVACASCGANLEIPPNVTQVTCRYCGTQLRAEHSHGASWTKLANDVRELSEIVRLRGELQDLEQKWAAERNGERGKADSPSRAGHAMWAALASCAALTAAAFVAESSAGAIILVALALLALPIGLIVAISNAASGPTREDEYRRAKAKLDHAIAAAEKRGGRATS